MGADGREGQSVLRVRGGIGRFELPQHFLDIDLPALDRFQHGEPRGVITRGFELLLRRDERGGNDLDALR